MTPSWLTPGTLVARVSLLRGRPVSWAPARVTRISKRYVFLGRDRFPLAGLHDGFLISADREGSAFTRLAPISSDWSRRSRREVSRELRRRKIEALVGAS